MCQSIARKKWFILPLLLAAILVIVACQPRSPAEEISVVDAQIFVFPDEPEKRLISSEEVKQNNCDGSAETSQTVTREHTVQYTIEVGAGLTVNADGMVGVQGIGVVGVGAEVALHYSVGYGRQETVSRAITVAGAPKTHIEHIIRQFEVWETGEVLIVAGNLNQRLPYSFRRDFSIEAVAPADLGCTPQANSVTKSSEPDETAPPPTDTRNETRSDTLALYDSIYQEYGWCSLWDQLISPMSLNLK